VRPDLRSSARLSSFFPFHSHRDFFRAKRAADKAVRKALRDGTLVRQGCERCTLKRRIEAHHDDYSKPLEVRWLCRFHHRQRDAELRAERGPHARQMSRLLVASFPAVQREAIATKRSRGHLLGCPAAEALIREATLTLFDVMATERVTESMLARRLDRSRQMVNSGFAAGIRTFATFAAYADALGYDASVVLRKRVSVERSA